MRGQGPPMYSTVRCQVWKTSVSLLPQHDVCFFSHDQNLVTWRQQQCLFKSQMRTGRQDLARQATTWKIREGLGWQRPKQSSVSGRSPVHWLGQWPLFIWNNMKPNSKLHLSLGLALSHVSSTVTSALYCSIYNTDLVRMKTSVWSYKTASKYTPKSLAYQEEICMPHLMHTDILYLKLMCAPFNLKT